MLLSFLVGATYAQEVRKILVLHGGGGNPSSISGAVADIENELGSDYEFVYGSGGYGSSASRLWIPDPPGGKGEPTTDPDIAINSVENLDQILEDEGPFYGIMGYSQGAAFVAVYLSKVPANTFEVALMFCGYLTETHLGLLDGVNDASPFDDIPALVWMGGTDGIITNSLSYDLAAKFTDPVVIRDADEGHIVPGTSQDTFDSVVEFIRTGSDTSDGSDPTPGPTVDFDDGPDPTPAPTIYCVDDPDFRNNKGKKCPWVRPLKRQNKYCGAWIYRTRCPLSCGLCCNDEPNFTFIKKKVRTCSFIEDTGKYKLCKKKLPDGSRVRDHCARTCDNCFLS